MLAAARYSSQSAQSAQSAGPATPSPWTQPESCDNGPFEEIVRTVRYSPFRMLVICTGNRARSQMAHGWLGHLGGERVAVRSAGTVPKGVHPVAVRVMAEVGIDISGHTSNHVDEYVDEDFDLVLTVCDHAKETCPVFPGARRTAHRAFEDPDYPCMGEEEFTDVFRRIRDEIGDFSRKLLARELRE